MSGVEAVVGDARFTTIFKNSGQQKDVEVQIEVMLLPHVFNIGFSPHFLSTVLLCWSDSFFGK